MEGLAYEPGSAAASDEWGRYHGPWCGRLVEQLAAMWNAEHVHPCCSGTAAVELGLRGIGVQAGDEVVVAVYDRVAFGGLSREQFVAAVRAEGIAIDAGFRALHRTHARSRFRTAGDLPHAESAEASLVTLHHPVLLGGGDDLAEVVAAIEKVRAWSGELLAIAPNG